MPEDQGRSQSSQSARWERLLVLLADRDRLSVTEAASELAVSESTIRRDFDLMADRHLARRTHGGIVAAAVAYGLPQRYGRITPALEAIATRAAHEILQRFPTNPVIGINGGNTTTVFSEKLGQLSEVHDHSRAAVSFDEPKMTVVTSALNIATSLVLRPQVRIVCLGGVVRSQSYELTGPLATNSLSSLWLDCLVLGLVGMDTTAGVTCADADEAEVTKGLVEHCGHVMAVATSDKIGVRSFAQICTLKQIDTLVTDSGISAADRAALEAAKIEVIIA